MLNSLTAFFAGVGAFPFRGTFVLVTAFWVIAYVVVRFLGSRPGTKLDRADDVVILLCGFSLVGLTIGLMAGNSRSPAVDAAISAMLAVYGGLTVYLFGKDAGRRTQLSAALALIALACCLEYGVQTGAAFRVVGEEEERKLDDWHKMALARYQAELDAYKAAAQSASAPRPPSQSVSTPENGEKKR